MTSRRENERGSVQLFILGLGVSLLLLGGIAFDLWRILAERRELAALADAAAVAAISGIDEEVFRTSGVAELDPMRVDEQIAALLAEQPPSVIDGLSRPMVVISPAGCDLAVRFEREFDFALLDFGRAGNLTLSATGCAAPSQG